VIRLLRAELLKLRTTRLLLWLGLLIVALVALVVSLNAAQDTAFDLAQAGPQRDLFSISAASAVIAVILGIVSSAGEYAHKTAAQTFLVTPVRERVVVAKVLAAMVAGVALAAFAEAAAFGLAALWIVGKSAPFLLATHDILLLALGTLAAGALAGAIGAGFGAVVRRQTAAIVVALVWLALHAASKARIANQIQEDYAFKEVVSQSFEGYKKEFAALEQQVSPESPFGTLCTSVVEIIATTPSRVYDKHASDPTPMSTVAEAQYCPAIS